MSDFEFNTEQVTQDETYTGRTFDKDGEYEVRIAKGDRTVYSHSGVALPRVVTKTRADEMRKAIVTALNHPNELKVRVAERRDAELASWEARESANAKRERTIRKTVKDATAADNITLEAGDTVVVEYDKGGWRTNAWFEVKVVSASKLDISRYGESAKTKAVQEAKEENSGRVLMIENGEVKMLRKGAKVEREYSDVVRIYEAEYSTLGWSTAAKGKQVFVRADGVITTKSSWSSHNEDLTPLEFKTVEEAQEWIAQECPGEFRPRYTFAWAKKPVKKTAVPA